MLNSRNLIAMIGEAPLSHANFDYWRTLFESAEPYFMGLSTVSGKLLLSTK